MTAGATPRGARLLPSLRRPSHIPWEALLDAVAAIALLAGFTGVGGTTLHPASLALLAVGGVAAIARRHFPLVTTIGVTVASGLVLLTPDSAIPVWTIAQVVLFSAALRCRPQATIALGSLHAATLYLGALVALHAPPLSPAALITPLWTIAVVSLGFALRTQRAYVAALEVQAHNEARTRESETLHRIGEERLRIARDLHDSLAHSIAVVGVHALAAEATIDQAPELARRSLQEIHSTMRATQSELQQILRILRHGDERDTAVEPVAGAAGVPALISSFQETMHVVTDIEPIPVLDPVTGTALFRFVQEGLTNANKHGTGGAVLRLRHSPNRVVATIANSTGGPQQHQAVGGLGLIGMRERLESAGAELTVNAERGCFEVVGRFPSDAPETDEGCGA